MYTIIGLGEQGRAILYYLLRETKEKIRTIDSAVGDPSELFNDTSLATGLLNLTKEFDRINHTTARWSARGTFFWDHNRLYGSEKNVVINCLPTTYSQDIARICKERHYRYIDLGGDEFVTEAIYHDYGYKSDVATVPDCGIAPGLVSCLAKKLENQDPNLDAIKIYCGGIPRYPKLPLGYIRSFSVQGLIKEYSGVSCIRREGEVEYIPTLSERELIAVPGLGALEAAATSGGVSLLPGKLKVPNFEYKTLRYPGHFDYVEKRILSQTDPEMIFERMLEPVTSENEDLIVLVARTYRNGKKASEYCRFWGYDHYADISAMAQATGYSAAAVATLVHELDLTGVMGMEDFDFDEIKRRMKLMANQFQKKLWSPG